MGCESDHISLSDTSDILPAMCGHHTSGAGAGAGILPESTTLPTAGSYWTLVRHHTLHKSQAHNRISSANEGVLCALLHDNMASPLRAIGLVMVAPKAMLRMHATIRCMVHNVSKQATERQRHGEWLDGCCLMAPGWASKKMCRCLLTTSTSRPGGLVRVSGPVPWERRDLVIQALSSQISKM